MERGRKVVRRRRARSLPFACASVKQGEVMTAQATDEVSAPILDFSGSLWSRRGATNSFYHTPECCTGALFDSNRRCPSTYYIKALYSVRLPAMA
jgi:hypothetical protein